MIELHVHLDGSLRPATAMELAREQGVEAPAASLEEFTDRHMRVPENCPDLETCLKRFDIPIRVLSNPDAIGRATKELTEDLASEGFSYAEIRFAPQYARFTGYGQQEYVEAAIDGMKKALDKAPSMKAALILCCMRGNDNQKENEETIRLTARYLDSGVCAADLAGAEGLFPTENFASVFALARKLDVPYTIHAGEGAGAESVRQALAMEPRRIGHGVRAAEDPELVCELARRKIALEVCYTSNVQTQAMKNGQEHPFRLLYDAGVHVTVNTDNRTISDVRLADEIRRVQQKFQFTDQDIAVMQEYAREAAFTRL